MDQRSSALNRIARVGLLAASAGLLALAGCPKSSGDAGLPSSPGLPAQVDSADGVQLWAEPSLRGALEALAPLLGQALPDGFAVTYVERGTLLAAAQTGSLDAPERSLPTPEVLLYTDAGVFDLLRQHDVIDAASARTFAGDGLALLRKAGTTWDAGGFAEFPQLQFKALGLGAPGTSAGHFGRQALVSDGVEPRVAERIREFQSYDELLSALDSGAVELVVGFRSTAAQDQRFAVSALPDYDLHEDIRYQAYAVKGRMSDPAVIELLRVLGTDAGAQKLLGGFGYLDREAALVKR